MSVTCTELGFTCLIALEEADEVLINALHRAFAYAAPRSALRVERRRAWDDEQALFIEVDGHEFAAVLIADRVPEPELSTAIRHSIFWPDARAALSQHRAMLAIGAIDRVASHGLARAQSVALTKLVAALVEILPSCGVYWRGSEVCTSPERIARAPSEITAGKWPVDVWIGYQLFGQDDPDTPVLGLQTRGAAAFLGFELEIPPFPVEERKEPIRILYNAAGYLMNFGDVIRDGQLVEVSGERRTSYQLHLGARGQPGLARLTVTGSDHRKLN